MNDTRPVNLDLMSIKLPLSALASILHRVSAVIIWVGFAVLLAVLCYATRSEESFQELAALLSGNFIVQFVVWGFLSALGYYCVATLKHLVQDFGFFEDKQSGQVISGVTLGLGALMVILAGILVWL